MKAKFLKDYHNPASIYVNKEHKWVWLRIHKNAGTSMYDGFLKDHCHNMVKKPKGVHDPVVDEWIMGITDEELEEYTVWACVRNPYDRFCSMAAMFRIEPNRFARSFWNFREAKGIIRRHSEPQHKFTHKGKYSMLTRYIKFENLEADFEGLCKSLHLPAHKLGHLNSSPREGHWMEVLDKDSIKFINGVYYFDFEYFGYKMAIL